ncbi:MAG: DEAD/DEAH box helicase [Alphaproteobacteria bacterium]|nr:DEAD/DEAH box helicase [Alphaproteobacteria bacterium]
MEVFDLRNNVVNDYADYVRSFIEIRDPAIRQKVESELRDGFLWPDPLVQLNPSFEPGVSTENLVAQGRLHPLCLDIFCDKPDPHTNRGPLRFHHHQVEGFDAARRGENYVLTTGTGSGKSLSYIVPIVDHVLRRGSGRGIQAIIVYPMNALANSQRGELEKYLQHGFGSAPVTFARYTGQERDEERDAVVERPPDILLTNYVMLELILTRTREQRLVSGMGDLRFLVFDELHTYRGRQGADVAMLIRRVRDASGAQNLLHVGTSATMAGGATWADQQAEVASVASRLFGAPVPAHNVIGETLRRATHPFDPANVEAVRRAVQGEPIPTDPDAFRAHPLASWVESALGLREEPGSGRLVRCEPKSLVGSESVAEDLAELSGESVSDCEDAIRRTLMTGYAVRDEHDRPIFAFRLHQFVSKGESVYASPEAEDERFLTLNAQQFVPGSNREKVLLPLAFCRECGQEYYVVRRNQSDDGAVSYEPRELRDRFHDDDQGEPGFLHINTKEGERWPQDLDDVKARLPDSWLEDGRDGTPVVRKARKDRLPKTIGLSPDGREGQGHLAAQWMRAPFLFCLRCGVAYDAHQSSDYGKLATLGSEGRSTATTVLTLSAIRRLRGDQDLPAKARKLLSFTDNRQDASLQAGHFNDFVHVTLLRSALHRAAERAGTEGIRHDDLTQRVFDALDLPLDVYAQNPQVEYFQLEETHRALRKVLGYYLYRDLKRGWRVTQPNLEQCGLLSIDYLSLDRLSADQAKWDDRHPALAAASPEQREAVCRVLLDFMRRELALSVDVLDARDQERVTALSRQHLTGAWALEDEERLERASIVLPRSQSEGERSQGRFVYLSARGGYGQFLKRGGVLPSLGQKLGVDDVHQIIVDLLTVLARVGLVKEALPQRNADDVGGYQLNAAALVWRAADGSQGFHDPVRVPNAPETGLRTNPFFVDFYQSDADDIKRLEAREHTAQVAPPIREERERSFRDAKLPILYCSPTMELGVDISQLNVVNMRNVPPTPANYAQRSGRAGRSGQPAFVYVYCSAGSPHDQYFFKRPKRMVAGQVSTPRLELSNDDLLQAHVRALWLAESNLSLGQTLADVLDVAGDDPTLAVQPNVRDALDNLTTRDRALRRARTCLGEAVSALVGAEGSVDAWLRRVLNDVPNAFERACSRWRTLYRAAHAQAKRQAAIQRDQSRAPLDKDQARRMHGEAIAQLRLLVEVGSSNQQSDFYSYRYFASEGFLPGYNFPRLPLSAYLPGRRKQRHEEDYLSRPRFLAITEFGPRSVIYHEGHRYVINKVILPVEADEASIVRRAAVCGECGYVHDLGDATAPDRCEGCDARSPRLFDNFFRMQNVATRRRDRINSDEEERFRLGYEVRTGLRFQDREGRPSRRVGELRNADGEVLANLTYGDAATIWRINLGWRKRKKEDAAPGFELDVERGFWVSRPPADEDPDDPSTPRRARVIPYVEDHRNALLIEPAQPLPPDTMASLQAGLKAAVQELYQLEDSELAAEPLPDAGSRRSLLLYEAAEGGAGVLRQLIEDQDALADVARAALARAHFDPDTLADLHRAPRSREDCEAACYDCLMSYYNQRDHLELDRKKLPAVLGPWRTARVASSGGEAERDDRLEELKRACDSELERRWLDEVDRLGLRLPDRAQELVESCGARPDFTYPTAYVFIDGPHHDAPDQQDQDARQDERLEALKMVVRFHHAADWTAIFQRYPSIFGSLAAQD